MVQMCHVVHGIKASCMLAPEEPNPTSSQCTGSCLKQTLASRTGASGILSEARLYDKLPSQQAESEAQFTASSGRLLQIFGVDATCEDDVKPWVTSRSTQHTISEREREREPFWLKCCTFVERPVPPLCIGGDAGLTRGCNLWGAPVAFPQRCLS